jgi:hypothetical protein
MKSALSIFHVIAQMYNSKRSNYTSMQADADSKADEALGRGSNSNAQQPPEFALGQLSAHLRRRLDADSPVHGATCKWQLQVRPTATGRWNRHANSFVLKTHCVRTLQVYAQAYTTDMQSSQAQIIALLSHTVTTTNRPASPR